MGAFTTDIRRFFTRSGALKWLIIINVAVFVIVGLLGAISKLTGQSFLMFERWLSLPSGLMDFACTPWTIVTYMFTQYNLLHILFNMLCLYWFGQVLLLTLSDRHLLWLYFVGGLTGGVIYIAMYNLIPAFSEVNATLCGSSASVLAVMTVAAFRSPDYELNLLFIGAVKLKWIALVTILLAVIGIGGSNAGGEFAHLGGVLVGSLFGVMLRRGKDLSKIRFDLFAKNRTKEKRNVRASKVAAAMQNRRDDMARLDELLDKIKQSGYNSLTRRERSELESLSQRLQK